MLASVRQRIKKACVPNLTRRKCDLEAEPAVRINGFFRVSVYGNCDRPAKITVAIARAKLLLFLRPFRDDSSPSDNVSGFHLEEICKVAADGDFKLELHRLHAVVDNVEIFVHAAIKPPADRQAERSRRNGSRFCCDRTIGKKAPGRVIGDSAAIQKLPRFSVGEDSPAADNTCIEEIEPLFAWPIYLSVQVADKDGLCLMDGDLRRTDLNLERHGARLSFLTPLPVPCQAHGVWPPWLKDNPYQQRPGKHDGSYPQVSTAALPIDVKKLKRSM